MRTILLNYTVKLGIYQTRFLRIHGVYQSNIYSPSQNGMIDSLKVVLSGEHFTKTYSDEHRLAVLWTKSL